MIEPGADGRQAMARGGSLWHDPSFLLYWLAATVSAAGSSITLVVAPILIFQMTGSAPLTGALAATEALPYLVFGLFAGAAADRVNRPRLMTATSFLQGVVLATIPIAASLGQLQPLHIIGAALVSSSLYVWFDAANFGALPALVGRQRLVSATAILMSTTTLLSVLGPAMAGVLAVVIGPANAIGVDALTFMAAGIMIALVRWPRSRQPADADQVGFGASIRVGLRYVWRQPTIRALTLLGIGNSLTSGLVIGMAVVYATGALGLGRADARIGLLFTAIALGALAASALLPWLTKRMDPRRISAMGLLGAFICVVALGLAPELASAAGALFLWSLCQMGVAVNGVVVRQRLTPSELQGRVNIVARMIAFGGYPFGAVIGGLLAVSLPIRAVYLIGALAVGTSALLAARSPLWHPKEPFIDAVDD